MITAGLGEILVGEHDFESLDAGGAPLDRLNRRDQGTRLSDLVTRLPGPSVIALDGAWGTGKSHFLQLWAGSHAGLFGKEGKVVYFDAFAHDWQDDPLLGLTKAIAGEISFDDPTVVEMGKSALRVAGRLTSAALFGALKALPGGDAIGEGAKAALDVLAESSDEALAAMWQAEKQREVAIEAFREGLAELAKAHGKLILVIDELDRCRPDYALALLEIAKHAFAVPGVIFVLGVNLEALGHSVRKRYGAEVDAGLYLEKFVNLSFRLPELDVEGTAAWSMHFDARSATLGVPSELAECVRDMLHLLKPELSPSLRDISRVLARIALLPKDIASWQLMPRLVVLSSAIAEVMFTQELVNIRAGARHNIFLSKFSQAQGKASQNLLPEMGHAWAAATSQGHEHESEAIWHFAKIQLGLDWKGKQPHLNRLLNLSLDTFALSPEPQA